MTSILLIGFMLGMRHAIESDHVAAVASLATRRPTLRHAVLQGAVWGLGHTVTLFVACSAVLFLDRVMPERVVEGIEIAVGVMLVVLGLDVLRRLWRERIHFHTHRHGDGTVHLHAHSHRGESQHDPRHHRHAHPEGFPLRALGIGMMHGLAGSAALLLLTMGDAATPLGGLAYVALFGIGSIAGMALLSVVIAVPLQWSAQRVTWLHNGLQSAVGVVTIAVGSLLLYHNPALGRLLDA
jgi:ABC-type nickel/cobalt efflux system permease component RcnA